MPLISINPTRPKERGPSSLEKIALGLDIASKTLGMAFSVPDFLQKRELFPIQKEALEAERDIKKLEATPLSETEKESFRAMGVPEPYLRTRGLAESMGAKTYESAPQRTARLQAEATLELARKREARESAKSEREKDTPVVSRGEEARDIEFAKDWAQFNALGGQASADQNLKRGEAALALLKDKTKNLSGKDIGVMPEGLRAQLAPDSITVEQEVRSIVIPLLRQALGPQFTEREGEKIMAQTFDPRLDETVNAKRLESKLDELRRTIQTKQSAGKWFDSNRTLRGWVLPKSAPTKEDVDKF